MPGCSPTSVVAVHVLDFRQIAEAPQLRAMRPFASILLLVALGQQDVYVRLRKRERAEEVTPVKWGGGSVHIVAVAPMPWASVSDGNSSKTFGLTQTRMVVSGCLCQSVVMKHLPWAIYGRQGGEFLLQDGGYDLRWVGELFLGFLWFCFGWGEQTK